MMTMPPPRYRIIERGRRLVTVDTMTGQEVGLSAHLRADPTFGVRKPTEIGAMETTQAARSTAVVPVVAPQRSGAPVSSPWQPSAPRSMTGALTQGAPAAGNKAFRGIMVLVGVMIAIVLIFSLYLWFPIVALLWFPQTRPMVLDAAKKGIARLKAWVDAG